MDEALGLYIHIPFCREKCGYCDFYSAGNADTYAEPFFEALKAHIEEASPLSKTPADTVYFGGGTPLLLGIKRIVSLLALIKKRFALSRDPEITIEINPGSTTKRDLKKLRRAGFTRLSVGAQSANDEELQWLTRAHTFQDIKDTFEHARKVGFLNISADLMYGIPGQTEESFLSTLQSVLALEPDHISGYGLKVEKGTPFYTNLELLKLPDDDRQADFYKLMCEKLKSAGYHHYEISNFARPGYESRHNLKYWSLKPYIGFGPSAHSDFGGRRYSYIRDTAGYIDGILKGGTVIDELEEISRRERAMEYVCLRLRTSRGVRLSEYRREFSMPEEALERALSGFISRGLVISEGDRYTLSEDGFLLSNSILSEILLKTEA